MPIAPILSTSLRARYPEQHTFLTSGLELVSDPEAVLLVKKLLPRIKALGEAPAREPIWQDDRAALGLLEKRGIGPADFERLGRLVDIAQSLPEEERHALPEEETEEIEQLEHLKALRVWFEEWSAIARVAISRRSDLIRLGLARRRPRPGASPEPAPIADPAPVA